MNTLHKNTFGNTPACEVLADLLNTSKDVKMARWVCKHFAQYSTGMRQINEGINDERTRGKLFNLWFNHAKEQIEGSFLPDKIKSYLSNIDRTLYRRIMKGDFDERIATE